MKRIVLFTIVLFIVLTALAWSQDCGACPSKATCSKVKAEDITVYGVPLYPNAKFDEATTAFLTGSTGVKGKAYRTTDSLAKVAEYYTKKGLKAVLVANESAKFKQDGVDVTLQNPWQNMQSGQMVKDTLISIVKSE